MVVIEPELIKAERVTDSRETKSVSRVFVTPLQCGCCGVELAPGEPVVRYDYMLLDENTGVMWFPHQICLGCWRVLKPSESPWPAIPCDHCGRPVHIRRRTRRILCSVRCEKAFYRILRKRLWWTRCRMCFDIIKGKRRDVHYCSNKCRQRAYRSRDSNESGGTS